MNIPAASVDVTAALTTGVFIILGVFLCISVVTLCFLISSYFKDSGADLG